jgi:hypothetical protein
MAQASWHPRLGTFACAARAIKQELAGGAVPGPASEEGSIRGCNCCRITVLNLLSCLYLCCVNI